MKFIVLLIVVCVNAYAMQGNQPCDQSSSWSHSLMAPFKSLKKLTSQLMYRKPATRKEEYKEVLKKVFAAIEEYRGIKGRYPGVLSDLWINPEDESVMDWGPADVYSSSIVKPYLDKVIYQLEMTNNGKRTLSRVILSLEDRSDETTPPVVLHGAVVGDWK